MPGRSAGRHIREAWRCAGCVACGGAPLGPPGVWLCPDVQLGGPGPASPHGGWVCGRGCWGHLVDISFLEYNWGTDFSD